MSAIDVLSLAPVRALAGEIQLPGSKSISNRALLLAALARGQTTLRNLLHSEDTERMLTALGQLGIEITGSDDALTVTGTAGPMPKPNAAIHLDLGLAGTALRPLTAALTLGQGTFHLDGTQRMRERPIGDLVDALIPLGANISYTGNPGYPPLTITGNGLAGGQTRIRGDVSSQFLTALLMAAPYADSPVQIEIEGELVSRPYIDITLNMMQRFGIEVRHEDHQRFVVPQGCYQAPGSYLVEGDASSASYFLAAGAIAGSGVTVAGMGRNSIQGDAAFADVLRAMGAQVQWQPDSITVRPPGQGGLQAVDMDLNHIPDAAMTIAVLALFASGTTRIRNIANWRVKETDRLSAMATELRKLGASVEEDADAIAVTAPTQLRKAQIATYGDHRMAMCFSLAALTEVGVDIEEPNCVAKTFPDYFEQFAALTVQ
ncbi:MAG: 3-phosphoshikimate 1-carboxyvinyltransferase [Pseudomonadales bacterium]